MDRGRGRTSRARSVVATALGAVVAVGTAGCGAGPYGHSRSYEPLSEEAAAAEGAIAYDPVMAKRQPAEWADRTLSIFGVVLDRQELEGGKVDLALSMRLLEARNLCESRDESSCRTTVSEKEHERLHVRLTVTNPDDAAGPLSIGTGSLVRVVGTLAPDSSADGQSVVDATYYRHWPRGYYVTTAKSGVLRR